jgi:hypothetical protein
MELINLEVLWQMDEDEKYPREFALGGADEETRNVLLDSGISWIASGDVVVLKGEVVEQEPRAKDQQ